jgi:hypothetical protein
MYVPHPYELVDFVLDDRKENKQKSNLVGKRIFGKEATALHSAEIAFPLPRLPLRHHVLPRFNSLILDGRSIPVNVTKRDFREKSLPQKVMIFGHHGSF